VIGWARRFYETPEGKRTLLAWRCVVKLPHQGVCGVCGGCRRAADPEHPLPVVPTSYQTEEKPMTQVSKKIEASEEREGFEPFGTGAPNAPTSRGKPPLLNTRTVRSTTEVPKPRSLPCTTEGCEKAATYRVRLARAAAKPGAGGLDLCDLHMELAVKVAMGCGADLSVTNLALLAELEAPPPAEAFAYCELCDLEVDPTETLLIFRRFVLHLGCARKIGLSRRRGS
jgi:hypothetical protein